MSDCLTSIEWSMVFTGPAIEHDVDRFYTIMETLFEAFVPRQIIRGRTFPVWMNADLKKLIFEKRNLHYKWKLTGNLDCYAQFKSIRRTCSSLSRSLYAAYVRSIEEKIIGDSKHFWSYINEEKGLKTSIPSRMCLDDVDAEGDYQISELLANYFHSVHSNQSLSTIPDEFMPVKLSDVVLDGSQVLSAIVGLKYSNKPGPDGVPACFIRNCSLGLLTPLLHIFNYSYKCGVFPSKWNDAHIVRYSKVEKLRMCGTIDPYHFSARSQRFLRAFLPRSLKMYLLASLTQGSMVS